MFKIIFLLSLATGFYRSALAYRKYRSDEANAHVKSKKLIVKALTFGFTTFDGFKP